MTGSTGPNSDRFYYGVRRKVSADVHGQPLYDESPLQASDFMNPTPNDIFELGPSHAADVDRLHKALQVRHRHNQLAAVLRDVQIRWPDPTMDQPRADILVAIQNEGSTAQNGVLGTFEVHAWGGPPRCIVEVLSPRFVDFDLNDKRELYASGGVNEYIIVDSGLRENNETVEYKVLGYCLADSVYQPIDPDAEGFVASEVNRVKIGPNTDQSGFVVLDIRTGEPIQAENVAANDRIAEVQGSSRANHIGAALDLLNPNH